MNIINSNYTSEQLKKYYEKMEATVDPKLFSKVVRISIAITVAPCVIAGISLWCYWFVAKIPLLNLVFLISSLITALTLVFGSSITGFLADYHIKKGHHFFNPLNTTQLPEYMHDVLLSEKLSLLESGDLTVLKKGDSQVVLFKNKEGNEEQEYIACAVNIINNDTLDFSCHDEDIAKILASNNLL